ncbi:MAG: bifunctional hydroxymethylpyrimidine kinase/phosphomethylpyrimidine kinase [Bacteroidota bacterium]
MKILCIHSLAVHGTASLKTAITVLGADVLPVASLYLTGLTNMEGHRRTNVAFDSLLEGSFELCVSRKEKVILYIGYLGEASQLGLILRLIQRYRAWISDIVVDPVSGDQGRTYVSDSIIRAWPSLLAAADWAFPNYTELRLFSGLPMEENHEADVYQQRFENRFPGLSYVATSLPHPDKMHLRMKHKKTQAMFLHELLDVHFGGTGDLFATSFIKYHFLQGHSAQWAMEEAAKFTLQQIRHSIELGRDELVIH